MKFNQLRDFVAVAEVGSLRGAARTLSLAQPAITRSIQELEHSLGTQLFVREARGVRLTPIGEEFLTRARAILEEIRRAQESVQQQQQDAEGSLVIGLSVVAHLGIAGSVLPPFNKRYPRVRLRIIEGFLPTLDKDLRQGLIDLFVGPVPDGTQSGDLQYTPLFENKRVVVARKGHPLVKATGQAQSALSILTLMLNTDMLAMMPVQWVNSPLLKPWLEEIDLDEDFRAPPIMMVHRAGLGLTPAGEYFAHLVQRSSLQMQAL